MAYWSPAEPLPDLLGFPVRLMLLFQMNSLPNAHLWLLIEPHWVIIGPLSHELASAGTWVPSTGVQNGFGPLPPRFSRNRLCRVFVPRHLQPRLLIHIIPCSRGPLRSGH